MSERSKELRALDAVQESIEPQAATAMLTTNMDMNEISLMSIAISLKRIADAMECDDDGALADRQRERD